VVVCCGVGVPVVGFVVVGVVCGVGFEEVVEPLA
jgi:hypothetical protein